MGPKKSARNSVVRRTAFKGFLLGIIATSFIYRSLWLQHKFNNFESLLSPSASAVTIFTVFEEADINEDCQQLVTASWLSQAAEVVVLVRNSTQCPLREVATEGQSLRCVVHACAVGAHLSAGCLLQAIAMVASEDTLFFVPYGAIFSGMQSTLAAVGQLGPQFVAFGRQRHVSPHEACAAFKSQLGGSNAINSFGAPPSSSAIPPMLFSKGSLSLAAMPLYPFEHGEWVSWLIEETAKHTDAAVVSAAKTIEVLAPMPRSRAVPGEVGPPFSRYVYGRQSNPFGRVENSMYVAHLSKGVVHVKESPKGSLAKLLSSKAHHSGYVTLVSATKNDLILLNNWLCWARRVGFESFVFVPMDAPSAAAFKRSTLPFIDLSNFASERLLYEGGNTAEITNAWARLSMYALELGYGFLSIDLDTFIVGSPFHHFGKSCDILGRLGKDGQISAEFFAVAPSAKGLAFWQQVLRCRFRRTGSKALLVSQCVTKVMSKSSKLPTANFCRVDQKVVSDGYTFFVTQYPQQSGVFPEAIHVNSVSSAQSKIDLLRQWSLWVDDDKGGCEAPKEMPRAVPRPSQFLLTIRVITMDRPQSLLRLLTSLQSAQYEGDTIHLELLVDRPFDADVSRPYLETLRIIKSTTWKHGSLTATVHNETQGLFNQWVRGYSAQSAGHVLLVLEDDLEVSPVFYTWAKTAIHYYYLTPSNYDPAMYGISLERQHVVLGLGKKFSYPPKTHTMVAGGGPVYATQLDSSWGQFFFPEPWHQFVEWARATKAKQPEFEPCVPGLISNQWYLSRRATVWTVWLHRFAFDHGLYNLYFNYWWFNRGRVHASLVINHKETGLHFQKENEADEEVFFTATPVFHFRPTQRLPVFDFYMEPVAERRVLADRWRQVSGLKDICFVVENGKGRRDA
jgi:hypothetical protein